MPQKPMTAGEERRFVLSELGEIKKLSLSSDRALNGVNGDTGLKADVKDFGKQLVGINGKCHQYDKNFTALTILLRGDAQDKNDSGLVGEHIVLKDFVDDQKKKFDRLQFWFFTLVGGLVITGILTVALTNVLG